MWRKLAFYFPEIRNSLKFSRLQIIAIISMSYGLRIARTICTARLSWAGFHTFMDSMDSMKFRVFLPEKVLVVRRDEQRKTGAGDGDRTRNQRLGKPLLYH